MRTLERWDSVMVNDPWIEADKHVLMADWEGNLSLDPKKNSNGIVVRVVE